MPKTKGKALSSRELQRTIAGYKQRQERRRLDADQDDMSNMDNETPQVATTPSDTVAFIKNRRDERDQGGAPETIEEALYTIANLDEDVDSLLDVIEKLQAQQDYASSAPDQNGDSSYEISGSSDDDGDTSVTINVDAMDRIVTERLQLARIGDTLRLDGKGATYINAAFDVALTEITNTKSTDYQRQQMSQRRADGHSGQPTAQTGANAAGERMMDRMRGE